MKVCFRCKEEKPYSVFWKMKASKDGYNPSCKECYKDEIKTKTDEYIERNKNRVFKDSDTKKCSKCKKTKSYKEFSKQSHSASGLAAYCKECLNPINRIRGKKHYETNKERLQEKHRNYYWDNKESFLAHQKIYRDTNRIEIRMRKYGGTEADYHNLMKMQSGCCAICGTDEQELFPDHCHICGFKNFDAVRGLLCQNCNSHSSFTLDYPKNLLVKAYEYALPHWNKYHRDLED